MFIFRPAVKSGLTDLIYYIVIYMQITGEFFLMLFEERKPYLDEVMECFFVLMKIVHNSAKLQSKFRGFTTFGDYWISVFMRNLKV